MIVKLNGDLFTEIDFETSDKKYEVSTAFGGKEKQLIERCVLARLRGKTVVGISGAAEQENQKFQSYANILDSLTFNSEEIISILGQLVDNPSQYIDNKPLSDYFAGFEFMQ